MEESKSRETYFNQKPDWPFRQKSSRTKDMLLNIPSYKLVDDKDKDEYDHDDEFIDLKVGMMFSSEETNSCLS